MTIGSINIDDAGTPGVISKSRFLPESRKSWAAVIIPSCAVKDVNRGLEILLDGIKTDFGANELHFTDIYGGRGQWKEVPPPERIEIFDYMTSLMDGLSLPIIFQTVSKSTLKDHPQFQLLKRKKGSWWNIKNISHFGLLVLCSKISRYFKQLQQESPSDFPIPLPTYVDEGIAKAGASIVLPSWGDAIQNQKLSFVKSIGNPGIQIADFAAFTISRTQWIAAKQEPGQSLSRGDRQFMEIIGGLNILNLPFLSVDAKTFSRETYEFQLMLDRLDKGLSRKPSTE